MAACAMPPQPVPDAQSAPFWQGAAAGKLMLQYGPDSGKWQFPPLERDRFTGGLLDWREVRGRGTVYSFVVQHQRATPGFDGQLPYVIALIDLDEAPGVRLPSRLIDAPHCVRIGARVACSFVPLPGGPFHVPVFHLVEQ